MKDIKDRIIHFLGDKKGDKLHEDLYISHNDKNNTCIKKAVCLPII